MKKNEVHVLLRSLFFILAILPLLAVQTSSACTAYLISGTEDPIVAKNLDWISGQGFLLINKKNISKEAIFVETRNPLRWTSQYSSVTFSGSAQDFPWEGMNEAGLSVNALQLFPADKSKITEKIPSVGYVQWIQYILDTSANINEAIENAKKVRISYEATLHYFVCDANANCATFEYIQGQLIVHSGDSLPIKALTNDTYKTSLEAYHQSGSAKLGLSHLDPKDNRSLARFFRAALLSQSPKDYRKSSIETAFSGLENLSQKTQSPPLHYEWFTQWRIVFDLKNRRVYWKTLNSPHVKFLSLKDFDSSCKAETLYLDLDHPQAGDVKEAMLPMTLAINKKMVRVWASESGLDVSDSEKRMLENYPLNFTRCHDIKNK
ncbi:MAG: linear amide C-N hydrolase [Proteobacteria bacterium]|nr:linear amide C-N hydrolase [Pseudomonadota bacterium]